MPLNLFLGDVRLKIRHGGHIFEVLCDYKASTALEGVMTLVATLLAVVSTSNQ